MSSTTTTVVFLIVFWLFVLSSFFWDDDLGGGEDHLDRYSVWLFQKLIVQPLKVGWRQSKLFWQRAVLRIQPKALVQLASELGLAVQRYRFSSIELGGERGSLAAEVSCWIGRSVTARIENPGIPTAFLVTLKRFLATSELQTGDDVFDSEITVGGDSVTALALLDQHTRRQLRELVALGGEVGDSAIKISKNGLGLGALALVREGSSALDLAVEFSRLLTIEGPEVPGRLARNAENDPVPAVRRQNLQALGRHFPLHPESLRQHRAALEDKLPAMRHLAADFLITLPGVDSETAAAAARVLVQLARTSDLPENLRVRAIEGLTSQKETVDAVRSEAEKLIEELLAAENGAPLTAAIGSLAALGLRSHIPRLAELAITADSPVKLAIAKALGVLGGPEAQATLLALLGRQEPAVLQETAKALGEVGDAKAVEPLLKLSRYGGGAPVSLFALEAVRRIQGRLIGAEAGQLSLAAPAELEGALSAYDLAAGPGDLSMAEAAPPESARDDRRRLIPEA